MEKINQKQFEQKFGKSAKIIWGEIPYGDAKYSIPWEGNCEVWLATPSSGVVVWENGCIYPFHIR
jgi:hypothetical protein